MTESNEVKVDERDVTLLVISFLALAATIGLLVFNLIQLESDSSTVRRDAALAAQTHRAACSYRDYLSQQAKNSRSYLLHHPNGAPALGLSAAYIQRQVDRQQAAADSLSDLTCS